MTVLVTADLHWAESIRDSYRHEFQKHLRSIIEKKKVDLLIILGDLTETKDRHGAALVNQIMGHLIALSELCSVIIVRGNHDYLDPDNPFFAFVEHFDEIYWVNQPMDGTSLDCPELEQLGRCLFLPHTIDHEKDWAGIEFGDYHWIFTHNTFSGVHVGYGHTLSGIPTNIFPDNCQVISGDIHIPQELGPVIYVGSPYLVDHGDDYKPRVLLIDGEIIKSIPAPGPQKRLVEVSSIEDLDNQKGLNEGDILKVRIKLAPGDHALWPELQAKVRQWGKDEGYIINKVQPVIEGAKATPSRRRDQVRKSDEQLVEEYVRKMEVKKGTAKVGLDLLRSA